MKIHSTFIAIAILALGTSVQAEFLVQPSSVTIVGASAEGAGANNNSFIDGQGLSNAHLYVTGSPVPGTWDTHSVADATENGNWRTGVFPPGGTNFTYTMNLGGSFTLTGMHIWNYNASTDSGFSSPGLGINRMLVEVSTNGGSSWTTAADYRSGGAFVMPTVNVPTAGQTFAFASAFPSIDTVRFSHMDSFWSPGGGDFYLYRKGIAEVRFTAVPEPSTALTASAILAALVLFGRRRKSKPVG